MRRGGLNWRIAGTCALLVAVVAVVFGVLLSAMSEQRHSAAAASHSEQVIAVSNALERMTIDLETGQRGFLVTGQRRFLEPWVKAKHDLPAKIAQLEALTANDREQLGRVRGIAAEIAGYQAQWSEPVMKVALRGRISAARAMSATGEGKRRTDALRAEFAQLTAREIALVAREQASARKHARQAAVLGVAALIVLVLAIAAFALALARYVVRPVKRVAGAASRLGAGDLSARVAEDGRGEVRDLAHAFNAMASSLRDSRDELETQNTELEAQQVELEGAFDELGREKAQVEEFRRFIELVSREKDPESLADVVLSGLCAHVGAPVGTLYGVDPDDGSVLKAMAALGVERRRLADEIMPGEGFAGRAIVERRILTAMFGEDGLQFESFGQTVRLSHEIHVPLVHGEQAVGVVTLGRTAARGLADGDLDRLRYLAAQAAIGLAHAFALRRARHQAAVNRAVLDTAHDAFVSFDERGRVTAWNPQAEATFGWSAREAAGKVLGELIAPERDRERHFKAIARFLAGKESDLLNRRVELTGLHRDGREFPVELTITPVRLGDHWHFNAFLHDISERRQLEERSTRLFSISLDLMCTFTTDGRLTEVNPAWSQMLGWSGDELLGSAMIDYVHPDDSEHMLEKVRELEAGAAGAAEFENRWRCADGSYRWLLWSARYSSDEDLVYAVAKDVTDNKRAERALRARYAVARALADADTLEQEVTGVLAAVGEGLGWELAAAWLPGEDGRVMRCAGTWMGAGEKDERFERYARQLELAPGLGLAGEAWEAGEPRWLADFRDVVGHASYPHAEDARELGVRSAVAVPLVGAEGVLSVIELLSRDVREPDDDLVRALAAIGEQVGQAVERRLARLESDRMKDEFLALVSHELRTPLTSIVGYLELLGDDDGDDLPDHARRFLDVIERNAIRLQRLVDDVLFATRAEAGQLALAAGSVELEGVASECVAAARPKAEERGVLLSVDADPIPRLVGDRDRLGQALDNLISNALKFTPPGGRIDVVIRNLGDLAKVEVRDTGLGMSAEDRERVFDRFFRAAATRDYAPGVGLGLTIVKTIVEGHGGTIDVKSTEGAGSSFQIELPIERRSAVSPQASRT